jgi:hypothetical protein
MIGKKLTRMWPMVDENPDIRSLHSRHADKAFRDMRATIAEKIVANRRAYLAERVASVLGIVAKPESISSTAETAKACAA